MIEGALQDGIISGRAIAAAVRGHVAEEVARLVAMGVQPSLTVVRVGADPASEVYVRGKVRACERVGIESREVHLPGSISRSELFAEIERVNGDDSVDGLLVQLPLPEHIKPTSIIPLVDAQKDVDGFHPTNMGHLFTRYSLLEPCTPVGILAMLRAIGVDPRGKRAVVVGRSMIVGRPVAEMLVRANATVTICHRHTKDLAHHVRAAEVLVVATGVPGLIRGEWVKEGAVVIDVGITQMPDGSLSGDVEFDVARTRAAAITPVPGGVGPMTIAMLLRNTVIACLFRRFGGGEAFRFGRRLFDELNTEPDADPADVVG